MNDNVLRTLEFEQIVRQLAEKAASESGKERCRSLKVMDDIEEVRQELSRTDEALAVLLTAASVPLAAFKDVRAAVHRAALGATVEPSELLQVMYTLNAVRRMKQFLSGLEQQYSWLDDAALRLVPQKYLEDAIGNTVDDGGQIRDTASAELNRIRKEMRIMRARIKERVDAMVRSQENQKYFSDAVVTMRNDRYVIPVKQEYRQQFPGIIHDTSGSGATVFVEPMAIVNINNDLRQLESREKHEIERILNQLSAEIGRFAEPVTESCIVLAEIDFVFAKARLALQMKATLPELNTVMEYRLKNARHPLIDAKKVVAVNVVYGKPHNLLLITGPNTGGKTVTLKTLGLFSLMTQAGLFIPADSGSTLPYYKDIYVDIGDEQSIEQNLSTFSGHMKNVIAIVEKAGYGDLVLFDEIGAGTDPEEGAALAQSILETLVNCGCMTVATTHYGALKSFGYNHENVRNASVEFDINTLSPTYRLLIGVPGSSNAFAISKRLGLPENIINRAAALVSGEHAVVERMLGKIDSDLRDANQELERAKRYREQADRLRSDSEKQLAAIEGKKQAVLEKARAEAADTIRRARAEAEFVIGELKKVSANELDKKQDDINVLRKLLGEKQREVENTEDVRIFDVEDGQILVGSNVYVASLNQAGTVESISGNTAVVQIGALRTSLPVKKLKLIKNRQEARQIAANKTSGTGVMKEIKRELDIRGLMVDEAAIIVDKFLDDGVMSGLTQLMLIHGKGTGLLRQGIREHLRNHPHVKSIAVAGHNEGGNGATLILLK